MNPIGYRMSRLLYPMNPTWEICMNEHLIRAITIRILEPKNGEEETKKRIREEYYRGFVYIEYVLNLLTEYENNRDTYEKFADFFPRVQAMFMELCEYPTIPMYLTCEYASQNGVQLIWADNSCDEVGFKIYRRESEDSEYVEISKVSENQEYYRDNDVKTGIEYQYIISAMGEKGEIFSNHIDVSISPTKPIAPKKLKINLDEEELKLEFKWDYTFKADGFKLYEITEERALVTEISNEENSYSIDIPEDGVHKYVLTAWVQADEESILESFDSNMAVVEIEFSD